MLLCAHTIMSLCSYTMILIYAHTYDDDLSPYYRANMCSHHHAVMCAYHDAVLCPYNHAALCSHHHAALCLHHHATMCLVAIFAYAHTFAVIMEKEQTLVDYQESVEILQAKVKRCLLYWNMLYFCCVSNQGAYMFQFCWWSFGPILDYFFRHGRWSRICS